MNAERIDYPLLCATSRKAPARMQQPTMGVRSLISTKTNEVSGYYLYYSDASDYRLPVDFGARSLLEAAYRILSNHSCDRRASRTVIIRLSAVDLQDELFLIAAEKMARTRQEFVPLLGLDICERALLADRSKNLQTIRRLRNAGYRISIRNFGSYGSSLSNLVDIGVDLVGLNREFLDHMFEDSRVYNVARSVVKMIRRVGAEVVVSDVLDSSEVETARDLGCQHWSSASDYWTFPAGNAKDNPVYGLTASAGHNSPELLRQPV